MSQINLILQNKLKIFERNNHSWPSKDAYDSNIMTKETTVMEAIESFPSFNQSQKLACVLSVALLDDLSSGSSSSSSHVHQLQRLVQLGSADSDSWVATVSNIVERRLFAGNVKELEAASANANADLDPAVAKLREKIGVCVGGSAAVGKAPTHPLCVPLQLCRVHLGDHQDVDPPGDDNSAEEDRGLEDMKCEYQSGYLTDDFFLFRPPVVSASAGSGQPQPQSQGQVASKRTGLTTAERFSAGPGAGAGAGAGGSLTRRFGSFTGTAGGAVTASTARTAPSMTGFRPVGSMVGSGGKGPAGNGSGSGSVATLSFEQLMEIKKNPKKRKLVDSGPDHNSTGSDGPSASPSQSQVQVQSTAVAGILAEYRESLASDDIRTLEAFGARTPGLSGTRKIRLHESELVNDKGRRVKEGVFVLLNFDDNTWKKFKKSKILDPD